MEIQDNDPHTILTSIRYSRPREHGRTLSGNSGQSASLYYSLTAKRKRQAFGSMVHASHAKMPSSIFCRHVAVCCNGACFESAPCTLHSLPWRSIMHHAATQLLDVSLLPFQDLYARFCYKASQKSMGWNKKFEGTDATGLLLRSFQLLFSRLGDQPFHAMTFVEEIEPRR